MYSILDSKKKTNRYFFGNTPKPDLENKKKKHLTTLTNDFPSLCVTTVILQRPYLEQSYH